MKDKKKYSIRSRKSKIILIAIFFIACFSLFSSHSGFFRLKISLASTTDTNTSAVSKYRVKSETQVGKIWGRVNIPKGEVDFLEKDGHKFIVYYGEDGYMTISGKKNNEEIWHSKKLKIAKDKKGKTIKNKVKCNSHNYINLDIDKNGFLHISGNMHNMPLIYYKSKKPYDIESIEYTDGGMIGKDEDSVTYPVFIKNKSYDLFFYYRNGISGNGEIYINSYDIRKKKWERINNTPLFSAATGTVDSAYPHNYVLGSDNYFHIFVIWRKYGLYYAKTNDFKNYYRSDNRPIDLPMTQNNIEMIDDSTFNEGLINYAFGYLYYVKNDDYDGPVIFYHKYKNNLSQIFVAYLSGKKWEKKQVTNFNCKWNFNPIVGGFRLEVYSLPDGFSVDKNQITFSYGYSFNSCSSKNISGSKTAIIRTNDFSLIKTIDYESPFIFPSDILMKESNIVGVITKSKHSPAESNPNKELNFIKWEAAESNEKCWDETVGPSRLLWYVLESDNNNSSFAP